LLSGKFFKFIASKNVIMKKIFRNVVLICLSSSMLVGCSSMNNTTKGGLLGGGIGTAVGAGIGALIGGKKEAAIGAIRTSKLRS